MKNFVLIAAPDDGSWQAFRVFESLWLAAVLGGLALWVAAGFACAIGILPGG